VTGSGVSKKISRGFVDQEQPPLWLIEESFALVNAFARIQAALAF
jgi:hypothetical protein